MDNLKLQLSLSIRARYPLIYLVTSEETRAEETLEEVGRTVGKEVITWTCSKGFQPESTPVIQLHKTTIRSPRW